MARRPLSKIKDIDDTNSLWRVAVLIKDSWIVNHGKSLKKHLELVVCDELVLIFFLPFREIYVVCDYLVCYIWVLIFPFILPILKNLSLLFSYFILLI
jgi:hypothetical protein